MKSKGKCRYVYLDDKNFISAKTSQEAEILQEKLDTILVLATMDCYEIEIKSYHTFSRVSLLREVGYDLYFIFDDWTNDVIKIKLCLPNPSNEEIVSNRKLSDDYPWEPLYYYEPLDKLISILGGEVICK